MKITYLGHSCFLLQSSAGKTLLTDPYTGVGYELPKGLSANVVTISHQHFDHNYLSAVAAGEVLDSAGIYETNGFIIVGEECYHDEKQGALRGKNILFKITIDGLTVCHLGDLGEEVSEEMHSKIGRADILLLPVGGKYTIDAAGAKAYVHAVQPKIVIPMHYLPKDGALDIQTEEAFLSGYEVEIPQNPGEITIDKKDVETNGKQTRVIFLRRKGK